jgi:hypothetical protein
MKSGTAVVIKVSAGRLAILVVAFIPVLAVAEDMQSVSKPAFRVGDTWVVNRTLQKGTANFTQQRVVQSIERLDSDGMLLSTKLDGSPLAPQENKIGLDWSLRLLIKDEEKTTSKPFHFPMHVDDDWSAEWTDPRRSGNQISAHFRRTYKVVGWEDVTVPAGTFHALKVEAKGTAEATMVVPSVAGGAVISSPGNATTVTHAQTGGTGVLRITTYSAEYYAPEVKHFVKTVEEQYNSSNVMIERDTHELASFKPGA